MRAIVKGRGDETVELARPYLRWPHAELTSSL